MRLRPHGDALAAAGSLDVAVDAFTAALDA
jgi:hypothetical protein